MTRRARALLPVVVLALTATAALTGCAPDTSAPTTPTPSSSGTAASATPSPDASATATPAATATPRPGALPLPTDCRAMLTDAVLAELGATPLNDPAFGPSGAQPDGSIICVWADPAADTTSLVTTIAHVDENETMDDLNQLVETDGFTCYQPDTGVRCEKTWQNATYPVTDGRTLYYRDGVLIDTQYSNLAPGGYTAAVVTAVFG